MEIEFDDEDEELTDLRRSYVASIPGKISEINKVHRSGDLTLCKTLVHKLCGSAGMYGLTSLFEICSCLENSILSGDKQQIDFHMQRLNSLTVS